jgi:polar amino acid transport system substrate-binding protein
MTGTVLLALGLALTACGSSGGSSAKTTDTKPAAGGSTIAAPDNISSAGKVVYCTDPTYPPVEFQQGSEMLGSDIDAGNEIAKRMGVSGEFTIVGFDGVIPALKSGKCDAILSAMTDTPERAKQVAFVDYMSVGQAVMVPKGNPDGVTSLGKLSGKAVSVLVGTANRDRIAQENDQLKAQGKDPIDIQVFQKDSDAANAMITGKVDAYASDAPGVAYYSGKYPDKFELAFPPIDEQPWGIATTRDATQLHDAIQQAVTAMYADGTLPAILKKYQLGASGLK